MPLYHSHTLLSYDEGHNGAESYHEFEYERFRNVLTNYPLH